MFVLINAIQAVLRKLKSILAFETSKLAFGVKSYAIPKSTKIRVCTGDTKGADANIEMTVSWLLEGLWSR